MTNFRVSYILGIVTREGEAVRGDDGEVEEKERIDGEKVESTLS